MKCEVECFKRGTDLTIKDWINQIETYFTIGQVPSEAFVGFMLMKVVPRHLNEIKQYHSLDYLGFREKLVEVFEEPDLATAYLNAFASLSQTRDESIFDDMHCARLLVLKEHPDLAHASRERILITSLLLRLYDRQLASSLAVVKIQTAADAERLAAEGEAVRRDQRSRRSTNNFLPDEPSAKHSGSLEEPSDAEPLEKKKTSSWQLSERSTRPEGVPIQARTPKNGAERQAPQDVTVAVSMATSNRIALDRIDKGPGALPLGPCSNASSARAITLCGTAHRCLQPNKQQNAQDKPEKRSLRSKLQCPRLAPRCLINLALRSSATEQQY